VSSLKTIEDRLSKCLIITKKYYDKQISELKKGDKLKNSIKKKIFDNEKEMTLNKSINKDNNEININEYLETVIPDSSIYQYCSFDYISGEIKLKSVQVIEDTILLFFHIASLELTVVNLKKINKQKVSNQLKNLNEFDKKKGNKTSTGNMNLSFDKNLINKKTTGIELNKLCNKSDNNIQSNLGHENLFEKLNKNLEEKESVTGSTKTNSLKENEKNNKGMYTTKDNYTIDTPKFCNKNSYVNNKLDKSADYQETSQVKENLSYSQILKKIEEAKVTHSFVPTNDYYNVFQNSLEIIHRKFFELCFEDYFPKIFTIERDMNSLMKLDSLYSYFIYLRGLKNLLFTDKNKIFFSNVFFSDE
jgi:hypothetical protein